MTTNRLSILRAPLKGILWHAGAVAFGTWLCSAVPANAGTELSFLPVPGEVPAAVAVIQTAPKPPHLTVLTPVATVTQQRANITPHGTATNDWGTYMRERGNKVVLDGKLVDKSTLTPLVGFLEFEDWQRLAGS